MARKAFITGALPNFSGFENWVKIMRQNVIFRHSRLKAVLIVLIRWCGTIFLFERQNFHQVCMESEKNRGIYAASLAQY
jgi:hypothetical protein